MVNQSSDRGKNGATKMGNSSKVYASALYAFWQGRYETAIETVTEEIKLGITTESSKYYRLWIEVLALRGDQASLRILAEHLGELIFTDFSDDYAALKGLIHWELGEKDAAQLYLRSVNDKTSNPYWAELSTIVGLWAGTEVPHQPLEALQNQFEDFFHIQTLITTHTMLGTSANKALKLSADRFPGNPIGELLKLDHNIEREDFKEALKICQALVTKFPGNRNYRLKLAYLKIEANQFDEALDEFTKIKTSDRDADFVLGRSLIQSRKALANGGTDQWTQAQNAFRDAEKILTEQGYFSEIRRVNQWHANVGKMENHEPTNDGKMWLFKVSAKIFNNLKNQPLNQVKNVALRLGQGPKRGDWCVIACDDYVADYYNDNKSTWRFGAVYQISHQVDHIFYQDQFFMRIVGRPESSVPMDCGPLTRKNSINGSELFELHEEAQKMIVALLARFAGPAKASSDLLNDYRKNVS